MEDKPRNGDIEYALESDDIKRTKFNSKRERAKCILQFLRLKFKQFNWPENEDTLLRKITHHSFNVAVPLKVGRTAPMFVLSFFLHSILFTGSALDSFNWRKELLVPADDLAVPADEAPPLVNCDDSPTGEKATVSDVSTEEPCWQTMWVTND